MKVIVDTNIIFSILLQRSSTLEDIFFDENTEFYAPNLLLVELFRHKEKIIKYSLLSVDELNELLQIVIGRIHFVSDQLLSVENTEKAYELCMDIDPSDTPFISLALELDALLWTKDKVLKVGLEKKGFDKFFH